jgi:hypothetical protein
VAALFKHDLNAVEAREHVARPFAEAVVFESGPVVRDVDVEAAVTKAAAFVGVEPTGSRLLRHPGAEPTPVEAEACSPARHRDMEVPEVDEGVDDNRVVLGRCRPVDDGGDSGNGGIEGEHGFLSTLVIPGPIGFPNDRLHFCWGHRVPGAPTAEALERSPDGRTLDNSVPCAHD